MDGHEDHLESMLGRHASHCVLQRDMGVVVSVEMLENDPTAGIHPTETELARDRLGSSVGATSPYTPQSGQS